MKWKNVVFVLHQILIVHFKIIYEWLIIMKLLNISSNIFCKIKHFLNNNEIEKTAKQNKKYNWNKQIKKKKNKKTMFINPNIFHISFWKKLN